VSAPETIPRAWFTAKVTVAQIERESVQQIRRLKLQVPGLEVPEVPFGTENARWQEFRDTLFAGDEIWEFNSPPELWETGQGRTGFVALRGGLIVSSIISGGAEA
jgi:hypothetical protein